MLGIDWRKKRTCTFSNVHMHTGSLSQGFNKKTPIWYDHTGQYFKRETINEIGWYTEDSTSTVNGLIVALPHGKFMSGYIWKENGERVYFQDIYDNKNDAVSNADSEAEIFADTVNEHFEKFNMYRDIEQKLEDQKKELATRYALRNHKVLANRNVSYLIELIRENIEALANE